MRFRRNPRPFSPAPDYPSHTTLSPPAPLLLDCIRWVQLHREDELVWDDGVAPESCIDFDAPHLSKWHGARWLAGGLGFFGVLLGAMALKGPERPAVARSLPFDNLKVELGRKNRA